MKEIQNLSQPSEYVNFIKDPCLTFLTIYENHQDLEQALKIKIPGQTYFFATNLVKDPKIYEVQTYSNSIKEIGLYDTSKRRSNLNGATIRIIDVKVDSFSPIIPLLKKKLNFTTEGIEYKGYGSLVDGKWNGAIEQLLNQELDIGKK